MPSALSYSTWSSSGVSTWTNMPLRRDRGSPSSIVSPLFSLSRPDPRATCHLATFGRSTIVATRNPIGATIASHSAHGNTNRLDFSDADPRDRRRRVHRQRDDRCAGRERARRDRVRQSLSRLSRRRLAARRRSFTATSRTPPSSSPRSKSTRIDAVIHMAGDALVGESMARSWQVLSDEPGRGPVAARSDARRRRETHRLFLDVCRLRRPRSDAARRGRCRPGPINPYGESKLAFERALDWFQAAHGLKAVPLRYFNAAGASSRSGERHDPETHLIPIVLGCRSRDASAGHHLRRRLSNARWHLRARLHPRAGSCRRAHAGARRFWRGTRRGWKSSTWAVAATDTRFARSSSAPVA